MYLIYLSLQRLQLGVGGGVHHGRKDSARPLWTAKIAALQTCYLDISPTKKNKGMYAKICTELQRKSAQRKKTPVGSAQSWRKLLKELQSSCFEAWRDKNVAQLHLFWGLQVGLLQLLYNSSRSHSCFKELHRGATFASTGNAKQLLPSNPDTLLEGAADTFVFLHAAKGPSVHAYINTQTHAYVY